MTTGIQNLSRSEILETAQVLRQSSQDGTPRVYTPDETAVLDAADMIVRERESGGIGGMIESAISALRGERVAAELALQKARQREAEVEALLQKKAGMQKAIELEKQALEKIKNLVTDYRQRITPEAEQTAMRSRFWARHDARFGEHLVHAVAGITEARLIALMLPDYERMSREEIGKLEREVADIDKQISKAKR
jgi:hypothetical protein